MAYTGPELMQDAGYAVTCDNLGNIFVAGTSANNGSGQDFITIKYSPAGAVLWRRFASGPGFISDRAFGVAVDSGGNALVTGLRPDANYAAITFVTLKYSTNGSLLWTRSFPAGMIDQYSPVGVAVDFEDSVVVWGTKANNSTAPPYDRDFVTLKYSSTGIPLWTNSFSGPYDDDIANGGWRGWRRQRFHHRIHAVALGRPDAHHLEIR
jgi:hypothetical protein